MDKAKILALVDTARGHIVAADHMCDELKVLRDPDSEWGPEMLEFVQNTIENLAHAISQLAPLITE